jgi:hypothetical protein
MSIKTRKLMVYDEVKTFWSKIKQPYRFIVKGKPRLDVMDYIAQPTIPKISYKGKLYIPIDWIKDFIDPDAWQKNNAGVRTHDIKI